MRAKEFVQEVKIDNQKGAGAVPYNTDIDYFGLRVQMRPSTFLRLALPLEEPTSAEGLAQHIQSGGAIGAPFLEVKIPAEWENGDFSVPAQVMGHEGRNRMTAIMKVEGDNPVEVHIIPRGGMRRRHITDDMITALNLRLVPERKSQPMNGPFFDGNSVQEGVKGAIAGLGAAAALGLGGAAYDAHKNPDNPPAVIKAIKGLFGKQTAPAPTVADKVDNVLKGSPPYEVLKFVARKAGLEGTELTQFIAQTAHETMNFRRMEEVGDANYFRKYDPKHNPRMARRLGNTQAGDGERYKGRGFIQLTGRYNYRIAGQALGLPLEDQPELASDPEVAAKIAVWYWKSRVQPRVDNFSDVKASTKPINPGLKGLKDRMAKFAHYSDKYGTD